MSPRPLSHHRARILHQYRTAPHVLLALDFDGTLVPIERDPMRPRLKAPQRRWLARIARRDNTTLSIVSGRAMADLVPRVGVPEAYYVGNHGLEIRHGKRWLVRPAARWTRLICAAERAVLQRWGAVPGIIVENKGAVLTVHFRARPRAEWDTMHVALTTLLRQMTRGQPLIVGRGKAVVELRPHTGQHKGWAVRQLSAAVKKATGRAPLILAIGDDRTDEDLFRAVNRSGITIHVGRQRTCAQYRTTTVEQVWALLRRLSVA